MLRFWRLPKFGQQWGHISKQGSSLLRFLLVETAQAAARNHPDWRRWTREALGKDAPFVAGAYIEEQTNRIVERYRRQMDAIVAFGGTPILFQTSQLQGKSAKEKAEIYRETCRGYSGVLARVRANVRC